MQRLTNEELDALESALAKTTPGEWTVEMDGPDDDDSQRPSGLKGITITAVLKEKA